MSGSEALVGSEHVDGAGLRYVVIAVDGGYAWLRVKEGENHIQLRVSELHQPASKGE